MKAARLWLLWPSSVHQRACPPSPTGRNVGLFSQFSFVVSAVLLELFRFVLKLVKGPAVASPFVVSQTPALSLDIGVKNHVKELWDSSSVDCYWKLVAAWNLFGTSLASAQEVERQRTRAKPVTASGPGTSLVEVPPKYQNMDMSSHPSPGSVFRHCSGPA